ncbi:alpha/beta fold hydrolase [Pseudoroseomonas wenyumeiae]
MSWWQQVAHFAATHCCVTFSHRGFAPSDTPPGGPRPEDYAGDLEALIAHLELRDPVLVGQSMGGWTGIDLALSRPGLLKALVLSATSGPIDPRQSEGAAAFEAWSARAQEALRQGAARGIHPAVGLRAAEEQPALHFLYRAIDELSTELDKESLRGRLMAARTRPASDLAAITIPTLWVTGAEDVVPLARGAAFRGGHAAGAACRGRAGRPFALFRAPGDLQCPAGGIPRRHVLKARIRS